MPQREATRPGGEKRYLNKSTRRIILFRSGYEVPLPCIFRKDPRDTYKYLTTVIPYQPEKGAPPIATLQVLVKILKAINEDSPAVPALLTDYILKVLCPS